MPSDHEVSRETKRKFREALEHKHTHGGVQEPGRRARGKVAGTHGAETKATYRRKSGM
jgi:hypothetical protein